MAHEISLDDFRQLVEMLQSAVTGMSELAARVKILEDANQASYAAAVALKDTQKQLFEMQKAQQEVLGLLKKNLDQLLIMTGGRPPMVN